MKRTTLTFSLLAELALARPGRADTPPPPDAPLAGEQAAKAAQDAKMRWFREARFGIFFNFGLYSYYGGIWKGQVRMANRCSEWMMIAAKAPVAEYAAAAAKFNPEGFDADEWIRTVRDAGARYVVFDAKHHDGFALFKSEASDFNIVDATPFKRDVVAEIAAACRRYGVRFGIYYSQNLDWHHPGGGGGGWDPAQKGRIEDYLDNVCIPQLRELLTNYGKVDILWYDISAAGKEAEGCRLRCEVAGQALSAVFATTNTGAANRYVDLPLGEVSLPAGESTLAVRPEVPAKGDALQLAVITLKPLP